MNGRRPGHDRAAGVRFRLVASCDAGTRTEDDRTRVMIIWATAATVGNAGTRSSTRTDPVYSTSRKRFHLLTDVRISHDYSVTCATPTAVSMRAPGTPMSRQVGVAPQAPPSPRSGADMADNSGPPRHSGVVEGSRQGQGSGRRRDRQRRPAPRGRGPAGQADAQREVAEKEAEAESAVRPPRPTRQAEVPPVRHIPNRGRSTRTVPDLSFGSETVRHRMFAAMEARPRRAARSRPPGPGIAGWPARRPGVN